RPSGNSTRNSELESVGAGVVRGALRSRAKHARGAGADVELTRFAVAGFALGAGAERFEGDAFGADVLLETAEPVKACGFFPVARVLGFGRARRREIADARASPGLAVVA